MLVSISHGGKIEVGSSTSPTGPQTRMIIQNGFPPPLRLEWLTPIARFFGSDDANHRRDSRKIPGMPGPSSRHRNFLLPAVGQPSPRTPYVLDFLTETTGHWTD